MTHSALCVGLVAAVASVCVMTAASSDEPGGLVVFNNGSFVYPLAVANSSANGIVVRTISLGHTVAKHPMQTHEVAFCGKRERAYVSLLTTGQLFEFSFDGAGAVNANVQRFTLNSQNSGTHNIAASRCYPSMLWISTQVGPLSCCVASYTLYGVKHIDLVSLALQLHARLTCLVRTHTATRPAPSLPTHSSSWQR